MSTLAEIEAAAVALTPAQRAHLENLLRELRAQEEEEHLQELYRRIGFEPLPQRPGAPVTREMVRQLREEEGI